jgi:ABC-type transport system involved in multi-copper enzyme maturation permease subunit
MKTIVRLTLLEAVRRRILWAFLGLTALIALLTAWGFTVLLDSAQRHGVTDVQIQVGVSQILILLAFMFSFVLAMSAAFLGAPSISSEVESGVLLAVLARPLRRSELILGRWLGLAIIVIAYTALAGAFELGATKLVTDYLPPEPIPAVAYLAGQAVVLLTVSVLLSTRLPGIAAGAICVVLFGLSWMAGVMGGIAAALSLPELASIASGARYLLPLDGLWKGTVFSLEPPSVVLLSQLVGGRGGQAVSANPFFASSGPSPVYLLYVALWVAVVLGLAILSFRRREI